MFENYPYVNFHDLNLDWLIERIMSAYGPDNPPPVGMVSSVNGETGDVVLYKSPYVTFPPINDSSWNIHRLASGQSSGIEFVNGQPAMRIDGINRYKIYDEGNPPPGGGGAVDSVDGMTGVVKTWANTTTPELDIPADSSGVYWDLRRGLSNGDTMGISFEYDSVNQTYKTYLIYTPYQGTQTKTELLTSASLPPTGVISVNGQSGIVVLTGANLAIDSDSQDTIKDITDDLRDDLDDVQTSTTNLQTDVGSLQTAMGTLQTQVGGIQNTVAGLNGALIPIEANSQQSIKQYIDNVQPGSANHRRLHLILADGVKTYGDIINEFYQYFQNILSVNPIDCLYIKFHINTEIYTVTGLTTTILELSTINPPDFHNFLSATVRIGNGVSTYSQRLEDMTMNSLTAQTAPAGTQFVMYI